MKTSARNQFTGIVSEVLIGAVNAEVHIGLKGGEIIVASITKESAETLDIKTGLEVIAWSKPRKSSSSPISAATGFQHATSCKAR